MCHNKLLMSLPPPIGGAGFADVVTSKRAIDTTVLAEDGQTIVLGGLIQDDVNDSESRVPGLGRIPFLGNLFKSTTKTKSKTNLLVFLRPTVIRSKEDARAATATKYSAVWEVEINSIGDDLERIVEGTRPK